LNHDVDLLVGPPGTVTVPSTLVVLGKTRVRLRSGTPSSSKVPLLETVVVTDVFCWTVTVILPEAALWAATCPD
jgi:hypothetical protein